MELINRQDLLELSHSKQVLFACFCAEQVMHLVQEEHKAICLGAVQVAYLSLEGRASKEECGVAARAVAAYAGCAADAAAAYAAHADANAAAAYAAYAAYAYGVAAKAAYGADKSTIVKDQWSYYDQLLNTDRYFEEILLEGNVNETILLQR